MQERRYKSVRTGRELVLTPQGAETFARRGMPLIALEEESQVEQTDQAPKVVGGKTKTTDDVAVQAEEVQEQTEEVKQ